MRQRFRIAIVGGGVTGLSAAFYLERLAEDRSIDLESTLIEKNPRLGGVIQTETIDGMLLEAGPEGWASYKPAGKKLVGDLGLGEELIGSNDARRRTLIVRDGTLTSLPDGMMFLAPVEPLVFWRSAPLSLRGKLRASLEPLVRRSRGDLSVHAFFRRRLGPEFTERLVEPLIAAVYGADSAQLSAPSSLPELYRAEQRAGSLWRGLRRFARISATVSVLATLRDGMGRLVDRLGESLTRTRVLLGIEGLRVSPLKGRVVLRADGFEEDFDRLILCTPADAAAELTGPILPEVAGELRRIPYASSTLVYLAYPRERFEHPLDAFGFIVPPGESLRMSACTWVNSKFDHRCPPDRVLLRCAIHHRNGIPATSDEETAGGAHEEIRRVMGIDCPPILHRVYRIRNGLPHLMVGHLDRLRRIHGAAAGCPEIQLAGSFIGGVGVPDCILTGLEAARRTIAAATGQPADSALPAPSYAKRGSKAQKGSSAR